MTSNALPCRSWNSVEDRMIERIDRKYSVQTNNTNISERYPLAAKPATAPLADFLKGDFTWSR